MCVGIKLPMLWLLKILLEWWWRWNGVGRMCGGIIVAVCDETIPAKEIAMRLKVEMEIPHSVKKEWTGFWVEKKGFSGLFCAAIRRGGTDTRRVLFLIACYLVSSLEEVRVD